LTLKRIAPIAGLIVVATLAAAYWIVGGPLVAPRRQRIPPPPPKLRTQPLTLPSLSGARLSAWLMVPESPRGAVAVLHGIHADRTAALARARLFWHAGYAVLAPDLQAHGESTGDVVTLGYKEAQDAVSSVSYMRNRFPGLPVGAVGLSLGGAALALAGKDLQADAIVMEAAYPDIEHATRNRIALRMGRVAELLTPLLLLQLRPRLGVGTEDLQPVAHIAELGCPVMVISGRDDPYTPADETRRLFAAARDPKELWLVPDAGHTDLFRRDPEGYRARVLGFLDRHLGAAAASSS
jgi:dipeptidyl aminopeptidase/acylaminoacyl peptidase